MRAQSQEGQDLCAAAAAAAVEELIFKTSTEKQNVDLTNKGMTRIPEIFAMVSQCLQNNRTDPLTCSCRWIHEGADLR